MLRLVLSHQLSSLRSPNIFIKVPTLDLLPQSDLKNLFIHWKNYQPWVLQRIQMSWNYQNCELSFQILTSYTNESGFWCSGRLYDSCQSERWSGGLRETESCINTSLNFRYFKRCLFRFCKWECSKNVDNLLLTSASRTKCFFLFIWSLLEHTPMCVTLDSSYWLLVILRTNRAIKKPSLSLMGSVRSNFSPAKPKIYFNKKIKNKTTNDKYRHNSQELTLCAPLFYTAQIIAKYK